MNFSYSFTVPESLLVIILIGAAMLFAVCILMFVDIWRELRRQKKTADEYSKFIQHKEEVERKARHPL